MSGGKPTSVARRRARKLTCASASAPRKTVPMTDVIGSPIVCTLPTATMSQHPVTPLTPPQHANQELIGFGTTQRHPERTHVPCIFHKILKRMSKHKLTPDHAHCFLEQLASPCCALN